MSKFIKLSAFQLNAPLDTEEVGKELSKLGNFTPTDVLDIAKSPKSPLHKYFEWDDSKAAHAYRLTQARHLVLSIGLESGGNQMRAFDSMAWQERLGLVGLGL